MWMAALGRVVILLLESSRDLMPSSVFCAVKLLFLGWDVPTGPEFRYYYCDIPRIIFFLNV